MNNIKKLKELLEDKNRIIATHEGANYNYVLPKDIELYHSTRKVYPEELEDKEEIAYFINVLKEEKYPMKNH